MRRGLLILFAALALAGAGCSSNDNGGGTTGGGTTGGTTGGATTGGSTGTTTGGGGCTASSATPLSGGLTIQSFAFSPDCFSVAAGDTVTVTNKDGLEHTFTVTDTSVDVGVDGGTSQDADFSGVAAGTYDFFCKIHPTMTGTVVVT